MKFLWESLEKLSPESEFSGGMTYESIICVKGVKPSLEEVETKNAELEAQYDANQYQRDRQPEYPSIPDQLDMQYWDKVNGTNNWQQAIQAVKMKHPKPEND